MERSTGPLALWFCREQVAMVANKLVYNMYMYIYRARMPLQLPLFAQVESGCQLVAQQAAAAFLGGETAWLCDDACYLLCLSRFLGGHSRRGLVVHGASLQLGHLGAELWPFGNRAGQKEGSWNCARVLGPFLGRRLGRGPTFGGRSCDRSACVWRLDAATHSPLELRRGAASQAPAQHFLFLEFVWCVRGLLADLRSPRNALMCRAITPAPRAKQVVRECRAGVSSGCL